MTEVRDLSSKTAADEGSYQHHHQYGLFAATAYSEGDVILTESPLVVLSSSASSSSSSYNNNVRSQFSASSLPAPAGKKSKSKNTAAGDDENNKPSPRSIRSGLVLPKSTTSNDLSALDSQRTSKLRGMILALASYAADPPSDNEKAKLLELYHPSIKEEGNDDANKDALKLAKLALNCCRKMAAPDSKLSSLLEKKDDNEELATKVVLIYSCNSFEGGRIYRRLSRANHACNPNAVVVEGESSADENANNDISVLKAACDIAAGDEITISYLGKYLYAGYPIRQRILRANKHFACRCIRCNVNDAEETGDDAKCEKATANKGDLASRIPCPICHPRTGRYLEDDVMFDEDANDDDDDDGFKVTYAIPANGLTAEERPVRSVAGITSIVPEGGDGGSTRKKKEGMAIKYMCMAEDKVFDHLESNDDGPSGGEKSKEKGGSGGADTTEAEREIDQQFLQMATSICGAQHWTTHFLNLSLIEETLASFHSMLMSMGQNPKKDAETMEELFVEIAEVADGIERAFKFASSLELNLDPAHWLFDYTMGLARTLVGLGDVKSQKYGAEWISKVEKYAERFEGDGMRKVVVALRDAWKRGGSEGGKNKSGDNNGKVQDGKGDCKRRKIA